MSKQNNKKIDFAYKKVGRRFGCIIVVAVAFVIYIIGKAAYTMTMERGYWLKVAEQKRSDSLQVTPARGNILSCDGQLMASSIPEYKMYMDFQVGGAEKDSLWKAKIDDICEGLHRIFPEKSAAAFKRDLEKGRKAMSRHWPIWDKRVDYTTFSEVQKLPVFNMKKYKGGFHWDEYNARQRPFGSLAQRTVGDMFGAKDTARCGLELSYDSILRGKNGIMHRRKVLSKYLSIIDKPAVDGADIVTTIDVNMQDLAERSVIDELKKINGDVGVAIVMEVTTGEVKAIVNMTKCSDGQYREIKNNAVSDLLEPGSVFKTASIMTALDDGVVDTTYKVDTGAGVWNMYGRDMKDHNWTHGGYGVISLPQTLLYSSNVGVSRIIDDHYRNHPEKFVEGIYRTGIAENLHIPIVGATTPRIRMPRRNSHGQWINWNKTALPWMSIGYETQIPPIYTLAFYNAIANDGCMVRPRFVKQVVKDGNVLIDFPVEVVKKQICKKRTLHEIQTILEHVVSQGTGKQAGSPWFAVAGKTGTAQISKGAAGYKSGGTNYLLSFAGYFPADAPRYSCIVCIQKRGLPASGGGMSGVVFHNIAEGIMAQSLKTDVAAARDSSSVLFPQVKTGNLLASDYVLTRLGFTVDGGWGGKWASGLPIWGEALHAKGVMELKRKPAYARKYVPNVLGMGAKDAVYLMESRGMRVKIEGRGTVKAQSVPAGKVIRKGMTCTLTMK